MHCLTVSYPSVPSVYHILCPLMICRASNASLVTTIMHLPKITHENRAGVIDRLRGEATLTGAESRICCGYIFLSEISATDEHGHVAFLRRFFLIGRLFPALNVCGTANHSPQLPSVDNLIVRLLFSQRCHNAPSARYI